MFDLYPLFSGEAWAVSRRVKKKKLYTLSRKMMQKTMLFPLAVTTAMLIMDQKLSSCRIYIVDRDE